MINCFILIFKYLSLNVLNFIYIHYLFLYDLNYFCVNLHYLLLYLISFLKYNISFILFYLINYFFMNIY